MSPEHIRSLALLFVIVLTGCWSSGESRVAFDLREELAFAQITSETALVDLGTPDEQGHLVEGWSPGGTIQGRSITWATGSRAIMAFVILEPRTLEASLIGWPLVFAGAPKQSVEVALNGTRVGRLEFDNTTEAQEHRLVLPKRHVRRGENLLELQHAYSRRPVDVLPGSRDVRQLAVAWDLFRFSERRTSPPMATDGDTRESLVLPRGSRVAYHFMLPSGGELTFNGVLARVETGSSQEELLAQGLLEIGFATSGQPDEHTRLIELTEWPGQRLVLPIPENPSGPTRVSLTAVARDPSSSVSFSVELLKPMLRSKASASKSVVTAREITYRTEAARPNILIYLVDTLRADHLGCYGYDRNVSPHIDSFAQDATLFRSMMAQSSWTRASVASVFTGLYPRTHGTNSRDDVLPASLPVLAELLAAHGYETVAYTVNGNVSSDFGFARGFEEFRLLRSRSSEPGENARSDVVNDAVFEWLNRRSPQRPFLLYAHTADPHGPYVPPGDLRKRFAPRVVNPTIGTLEHLKALKRLGVEDGAVAEQLRGLYDAEIAFNDAQFGTLMEELKARGLYDSTMIIFLSDHGEEFLDHGGWGHGSTLFPEQVFVPLIIRLPGGFAAGETRKDVVRQIDLLPTVLHVVGIAPPPGVEGRSVFGATPVTYPGAETSFAYLDLDGKQMESVYASRRLLVRDLISTTREASIWIAGVESDTGSSGDEEGLWEGYLLSLLRRHGARSEQREVSPTKESPELTEEVRKNLEALGYL